MITARNRETLILLVNYIARDIIELLFDF